MSLAPVPDLAPIPGMCPGVAVLAGGGDGGGGSGNGANDGSGDDSAGTEDGQQDASGDPSEGGEGCGDPVCPVTGRMFLDLYDFGFAGPLELRWIRSYNSRQSSESGELGHGWSHAFGLRVVVKRREVQVFDAAARLQIFPPLPDSGEPVHNGLGWSVRRDKDAIVLRTLDRLYRFGREVAPGHFLLASVGDRNGNIIELERDERGVLRAIRDGAGRPYRVETDSRGRITSIAVATEPTHLQWMEVARYEYDANGDLVRFTDAEGYVAHYVYDHHLMIEHRTPCGLSYCYRYDGRTQEARCLESWGEYVGSIDPALEKPIPPRPAGRDTRPIKGINRVRFTYVAAQRYTEVENGLGGVTRYFGDAAGRIVKKVNAGGGVTERSYDPETGTLVRETLPNGTVRNVVRNPDGTSGGFVDSDGERVITLPEEDHGELRFDERKESVLFRRYDARGNVVFVEHEDGTTEQYESDERGLLKWSIDRTGAQTTHTHDAMGNVVRVDRAGIGTERNEYDYLGRRIAHVDAKGHRTEWSWDRRSEVVGKRHADGSEIRIQRDANRNPVLVDEAGRISHFEYGGLGWLTKWVAPGGETFEYRYDVEGNLTLVKNPRGQLFRQTWDPALRCIGAVTFEGVTMRAGFDATGNQIWVETPDGRQTRSFDGADRFVGAEMPDGEVVAIEHDPATRTTKIDNGVVPLELEVDPGDRLIRDVQGRHESRLGWAGPNPKFLVSDVGVPLEYTRRPDHWVDRLVAGKTTVQFDVPEGKALLTYLGDRLVLRREYTPTHSLARQSLARLDRNLPAEVLATSADPGLILWRSYEYDAAQILRAEHRSDGTSIQYDLNASDQIAAKRIFRNGTQIHEERVAYDAAGTPLMPGARYDAQMRPVELGTERLEYDECGRLSRRYTDAGTWTYEWSSGGELLRVDAPDRVVKMLYDARGRRMAKRVYRQGEIVSDTSYVWSNNTLLHECNDLDGSVRTYLRDDHKWEPIAHVDSTATDGTAHFYIHDHNNSVDTVVDADGNVAWTADRTIYGDYRPTVEKTRVDVRFSNQHYDADVELVYNVRRWYDPRFGLYVSPDPLLLDGTINPRDYVPNPVHQVDPMGLRRPAAPTGSPGRRTGSYSPTGTYLLSPGHHATAGGTVNGQYVPGYVDAGDYAMTRGFNADIRRQVDNAGYAHGCHSCGSRDPGTESGHFVPDHQAPISSNRAAMGSRGRTPPGPVRLYPHCARCSRAQAQQARNESPEDRRARARAAATRNARGPRHDVQDRQDLRDQSAAVRASRSRPRGGYPAGY